VSVSFNIVSSHLASLSQGLSFSPTDTKKPPKSSILRTTMFLFCLSRSHLAFPTRGNDLERAVWLLAVCMQGTPGVIETRNAVLGFSYTPHSL
jgi:hypothetical protein